MADRQTNADIVYAFLQEARDPTLLSFVTQLNDGCKEIEGYYSEYDINPQTPANGFRSFVKIVDKYFERLAIIVSQNHATKQSRKMMKEFVVVTSTLVQTMELAQLSRKKGANADLTELTDLDCEILVKGFSTSEEDVRPFYSRVGPFWLKEDFIKDARMQKRLVTCLSVSSFRQKLKILHSKSYFRKIASRNAVNCTIQSVKRCANLNQFPTNILMRLVKKPPGVRIRTVDIDKNCEWLIEVPDTSSHATIRHNPLTKQTSGKTISCLVIEPKDGKKENKSLIIHSHGGAFITASPANFVLLLSHWSQRLGVPIVCPDYAKAPENQFPNGLQDILSSYLFFTSASDRVTQVLGFHPQHVVLTGDSSGGHLSLAATMALNTIRKMGGNVLMPNGISALYPCVTSGPMTFPSGVLVSVDNMLSPGLCALAFSSYAETGTAMPHSWHKSPDAAELMKQLAPRLKDPLYNLMAYNEFEDLKDIPLRVMVCEFDPILDQGLAIASKWRGEVKVQVARDLPHGFVMSRNLQPIRQEMDELLTGISELLTIRSDEEVVGNANEQLID